MAVVRPLVNWVAANHMPALLVAVVKNRAESLSPSAVRTVTNLPVEVAA